MGVDISGMNPIVRSPKPEMNWNSNPSDEERKAYWDRLTEWENENPGDYFRSNWWGWRPILMLCEYVNEEYELNFDFTKWGFNDGAGFDNQEDCDKLANALIDIIKTATEMEEAEDTIYVNLGSWVGIDGKFVNPDINEELNKEYEIGEILYGSVIMDDGMVVQPSHSAPLRHVQNFIKFLRECGGFEIW
jgi:benzoyl-CoA reductase/2-hydroxyglutaryl-CoA dehydratase subunit BcrC/BadD/HgdB